MLTTTLLRERILYGTGLPGFRLTSQALAGEELDRLVRLARLEAAVEESVRLAQQARQEPVRLAQQAQPGELERPDQQAPLAELERGTTHS